MAEVRVNGVRLAYELLGHGEPILFLAGTGMAKEFWLAASAPALVEAGYQVVLVDNRGVGGSDSPPATYAVADLAADTAGFIEQLGISPCRLVGHSLGGLAAELLAAERPDLVRAAALLCSAGPPTAFLRLWAQAQVEAARDDSDLPYMQATVTLATGLTPHQLRDDALVQGFAETLLARPPWPNPGRHGQFAAGVSWATQDAATHAARWAKISVPLLAVASEQDVWFPPAAARQLTQAVPGSELAVIPDSGHFGPLTHVAEVTKALLKFFATN
jgi:pimeloyl-ACP methyl ester carboxylesterase